MKWAYYNDNDAYVCQWQRNLIAAGHIPDGEVDERSILDVRADDLRGFRQCHFFAGILGWPLALKIAGWDPEREIWTGSAPCQPLSSAGEQRGHADERHLWPALFGLIDKCRPATVAGEQVANTLGREWLAGVRLDLEGLGYAVGAADLCAAGVKAPHARQRLYWVADTANADGRRGECGTETGTREGRLRRRRPAGGSVGDGLAVAGCAQLEGRDRIGGARSGDRRRRATLQRDGGPGVALGDAHVLVAGDGELQRGGEQRRAGGAESAGIGVGLADPNRVGPRGSDSGRQARDRVAGDCERRVGSPTRLGRGEGQREAVLQRWGRASRGPGFWDDVEWVLDAKGNARRLERGVTLLDHGVSGRLAVRRTKIEGEAEVLEENWYSRIGAIRGIGNAIVAELGAQFIGAFMECRP